ncbi:hypothetical protein CERZMDRAFT_84931 [Cercospora zeae-maydis SCOH1-5]|uniref:Uncharacterized protein n=1 Tax=Cercospora zeae-maydis SCOH1-5 TaxID=717836 RepID=A0A6A6FF17_9PEZI|nr:hypothetical protein CERZMDRAFT_84931 [Cercospora zeae-maydis SCOH1-5]
MLGSNPFSSSSSSSSSCSSKPPTGNQQTSFSVVPSNSTESIARQAYSALLEDDLAKLKASQAEQAQQASRPPSQEQEQDRKQIERIKFDLLKYGKTPEAIQDLRKPPWKYVSSQMVEKMDATKLWGRRQGGGMEREKDQRDGDVEMGGNDVDEGKGGEVKGGDGVGKTEDEPTEAVGGKPQRGSSRKQKEVKEAKEKEKEGWRPPSRKWSSRNGKKTITK